MVDADVILSCGSSVKRGLGALLSTVPTADFTRWFGFALNLYPGYPAPLLVTIPGIKLWTPKLPYGTWLSRPLVVGAAAAGNTFTYSGADVSGTNKIDSWLWIETAVSGQGLVKRLTAIGATTGTISGTWGTTLTPPGNVYFLSSSHTVLKTDMTVSSVTFGTDTIDMGAPHRLKDNDRVRLTSSGTMPAPLIAGVTYYVTASAANTFKLSLTEGGAVIDLTSNGTGTINLQRTFDNVVMRTNGTDAWTIAAQVGKSVEFYTAGVQRVITYNSEYQIQVDDSLTVVDGEGMQILDGASAGGQHLSTIGTGAAIKALQIRLNNAPCLLTGDDYPNYDLQPVGVAPSLTTAIVNCDIEMYTQFRARFGGEVYGLDLQRDSSTISPYPIGLSGGGTGFRPLLFAWQKDIQDYGFSPSSDDGLYEALSNGITSFRTLIEATGKTFKPRAFVVLCAENDQIISVGGAVRHLLIGENIKRLFNAVRTLVGNQKLPCIAVGPGSRNYPLQGLDSSAYDYYDSVYEQIEQLEMEDTYTTFIDLRDTSRYTFVSDNLHLTAASQINLGVDIPLGYDRIVAGSTLDDVGICNLALSHIGATARVTALDGSDTSAEARHCIRFYEPALRTLLEMHSWDFATRRIDATAVTNTREDEWDFAYEAPRGLAFAFAVLAPGSHNDAPSQPFIKEVDASGRTVIYTDVEDAVIRYNRYCTNTRRMSASFARALSWLLASDLVGPITKESDGKREAFCLAMMRTFFGTAASHDSNQRKTEPEIEAPWMPPFVTSQIDRGGFPLTGV